MPSNRILIRMDEKKPLQAAAGYLESPAHDLKFVMDKVRVLNVVQQKVKAWLEPALARQCQVANLAENRLVLIIPNAAIATQIRFLANDLLKKCAADPALQHVRQIECLVRPPASAAKAEKHVMAKLSSHSATTIRELAESIEDPVIREIMLRIAERS